MRLRSLPPYFMAAAALALCALAQQPKPGDLGFKDTPMLPGLPWHVHDPDQPHPPSLPPPAAPGAPPSDAIVLFNGKALSKRDEHVKEGNTEKAVEPRRKLAHGYIE